MALDENGDLVQRTGVARPVSSNACAAVLLVDDLQRMHMTTSVCTRTPSSVSQAWNIFGVVTGISSVKRSACPRVLRHDMRGAQPQTRAASRAHMREGTFPLAPIHHGLSVGGERSEGALQGLLFEGVVRGTGRRLIQG